MQALLRRHGLAPRKGMSQNFLVDAHALAAIVEAARPAPGEAVLELGAGLGVLTQALAPECARLVAIELDAQLAMLLREATAAYPHIEVMQDDLLRIEPRDLFAGQPYVLAANLPYKDTSRAFRHYLEAAQPPRAMVVMIQKEVAQRILAPVGDLSLLALSVRVSGAPSLVRVVSATAFWPAPKVDSAILRVDILPEPLLAPGEREGFFRVARAAFGQRRKQVHKTLSEGLALPSQTVRAALEAAGVDPTLRPEAIAVEAWLRLYRGLEEIGKKKEKGEWE